MGPSWSDNGRDLVSLVEDRMQALTAAAAAAAPTVVDTRGDKVKVV